MGAQDKRAIRPRVQPRLATILRRRVVDGAGQALHSGSSTLWLNKTALAALSCDGRYLDRLQTPFEWSPEAVAGQLAHTVVATDIAGHQSRGIDELVQYSWKRLLHRGGGAGRYLAGLRGPDADAVKAEAAKRGYGFRECFPVLPDWMHARTEVAFTWRLSDRVVCKGVPDLVVGRPDPQRQLQQLIDVKTGGRQPGHQEELRFHALLATIKYGVAPFRVATYYLDEADWVAEDVHADVLLQTADRLAAHVKRAVWLQSQPADAELTLRTGSACNWCTRAPTCPLTAMKPRHLAVA